MVPVAAEEVAAAVATAGVVPTAAAAVATAATLCQATVAVVAVKRHAGAPTAVAVAVAVAVMQAAAVAAGMVPLHGAGVLKVVQAAAAAPPMLLAGPVAQIHLGIHVGGATVLSVSLLRTPFTHPLHPLVRSTTCPIAGI